VVFKKPIYIFDHPATKMIPKDVGKRFRNTEELTEMIKSDEYKINKDWNYCWDLNWKKNFYRFLDKLWYKYGSKSQN